MNQTAKQVHKIEKHHHRKKKTQNSNLKANLQLKTLNFHKKTKKKWRNLNEPGEEMEAHATQKLVKKMKLCVIWIQPLVSQRKQIGKNYEVMKILERENE